MLGRAAYENPFLLAGVDRAFFGSDSPPQDRFTVFNRYCAYAEQELAAGTYLRHLAKPLHYLFQGQPGARQWRRYLSERCNPTAAGIDELVGAVKCVERAGAVPTAPNSNAAA